MTYRTRTMGAVTAGVTLLVVMACAGTASAKKVTYVGTAKEYPRAYVHFVLVGKGCPSGTHCFDNAKVEHVDAVSYKFVNCPDVLESAFDYDDVGGKTFKVSKKSHRFNASGTAFYGDQVTFKGQFVDKGTRARGWFTVVEDGCTTGRLSWDIPRSKSASN
jgi:hypothetical protein